MKLEPKDLAKLKPCKKSKTFLAKSKSLGSGKITRRVVVEIHLLSIRKKRKKKRKNREYASTVFKNKSKNTQSVWADFKFPNATTKLILQRWNRLRFPFTKHLLRKSKVISRVFSLLVPICKKYETKQIIDAIEVGHKLFNDRRFVYYWPYTKSLNMGLHTFLHLSSEQAKHYKNHKSFLSINKKHGIELPSSWFDECLKGWGYLKKTYCLSQLEDKYPEITEQAIKALQAQWGRELNDTGREKMIKFSRMLVNFCEMQEPKFDPYWLIDRIEDWLTTHHKLKVQKAYYMTTQNFWFVDIPECLRTFDPIGHRDIRMVYDKDKLFK